MSAVIYVLCMITALFCSWLLLRYFITRGGNLLLWSGLCFIGLSLNNLILILDKLIFLSIDLTTWRLLAELIAILPLLYGLVWEED